MISGYSQQLFFVFALISAVILTYKGTKKHRIITFLLTFWLLGASIIHLEAYNLPLKFLGGEMQYKRLVFLILLFYLTMFIFLKPRLPERIPRLPFEKYIFAFFGWFMVVIGYHFFTGTLGTRDFVEVAEGVMLVLVLFLVLKHIVTIEILQVLGRAIILVAVLSSLVAIVQFFGNPWFLRIGSDLTAFGGKLRSNGLFYAEYVHSYACVMALMVTLLGVKEGKIRNGLVALLLVGIVLSFHRMSWIVTIVIFVLYILLFNRTGFKKFIVWVPLAASIILFLSLEIFQVVDRVQESSFYKARLSQNSLDSREKLSEMALRHLDEIFFLGAGSSKSGVYYYAMMNAVNDRDWAMGLRGGFHNIYVYSLFFYGVPFAVIFILMLIVVIRYFLKSFFAGEAFSFFPFLFLVMFIIMNITNCFPVEYDFGFYLGLFLGCGAAVISKNIPADNLLIFKSA
jgi:hypothetical protein